MPVFSRCNLSRLAFLMVLCLPTYLSNLNLIGVFTSMLTDIVSNLRQADKHIWNNWRELLDEARMYVFLLFYCCVFALAISAKAENACNKKWEEGKTTF